MALTQLTPSGIPGQRYGSFAGKAADAGHGPHNPGTITQLMPFGAPGGLYGNFAGKEESAAPEPQPVVQSVVSTGGGGGSLGWFRTKKGRRRFEEFFDDIVDEVKREMAMAQARDELAELVERKGRVAKRDLEAALEQMRVRRRRRRAAVIFLLDS